MAIGVIAYNDYKYQNLLTEKNELEQNYGFCMDTLDGFMKDGEGMKDHLKGIRNNPSLEI